MIIVISLCGLLRRIFFRLLRRLPGVVVLEYTIFNIKYFIINSKITSFGSHNPSVVLVCIYIHTHTTSWWESDDRHTHMHTPMPTLELTDAQARTHTSGAWVPPSHTHMATGDLVDDDTHIPTPIPTPHAWFLAQTHISSSCLLEHSSRTHVAIHAKSLLILPVCEEFS